MAEKKSSGARATGAGLGRFLERQSPGSTASAPAGGGGTTPAKGARKAAGRAASTPTAGAGPRAARQRRATKGGKEQLLVYLQPQGIRELKLLSIDDRQSVSELVADAVNAYLQKRGRPPVA